PAAVVGAALCRAAGTGEGVVARALGRAVLLAGLLPSLAVAAPLQLPVGRLGAFAGLAIVRGRGLETALLQALACPLALGRALWLVAAQVLPLLGVGQALAIAFAVGAVAVGHAVAIDRVVLPVAAA